MIALLMSVNDPILGGVHLPSNPIILIPIIPHASIVLRRDGKRQVRSTESRLLKRGTDNLLLDRGTDNLLLDRRTGNLLLDRLRNRRRGGSSQARNGGRRLGRHVSRHSGQEGRVFG